MFQFLVRSSLNSATPKKVSISRDRLIKTGDFSDRAGYLCINQAIATTLKDFASSGKIRISLPVSKGAPFEIRVDELDIYKE